MYTDYISYKIDNSNECHYHLICVCVSVCLSLFPSLFILVFFFPVFVSIYISSNVILVTKVVFIGTFFVPF